MTDVEIEPDATARRIRQHLRQHPELVYDEYQPDATHSLDGACYVAAEAYYHAHGGQDSGLDIYCLSWSDVKPAYEGTHWYLQDGEAWIDIALDSVDQAQHIPFDRGRRRAFITGYDPSDRCERVLAALKIAV